MTPPTASHPAVDSTPLDLTVENGQLVRPLIQTDAWGYPRIQRTTVTLADLLDMLTPRTGLTRRAGTLLDLAIELVEMTASGEVVASPGTQAGTERWLAAPTPRRYARIADLLADAADAGLDREAVRTWVAAAVRQHAHDTLPGIEHDGQHSRRVAVHRAKLAAARTPAGVRLGVGLEHAGDDAWILRPLLASDTAHHEPVPLTGTAADAVRAGCHPDALQDLLVVEAAALADTWSTCPLLQHTRGGYAAKPARLTLAPASVDGRVLLDLARVAGELGAHGTPLWLDGRPVRLASTVSARISRSAGSGLLAGHTLGLRADVSIDGVGLSGDDLSGLHAAGPVIAAGGEWLLLDARTRRTLQRLATVHQDGGSVADLLCDSDLDHVEFDESVWARPRKPRRVRVPKAFSGTLYPYQRDGLDWLTWLEENEAGGILADEMGLGKTAQLLARIAADHPGPTLVVVKLSTIANWQREAARFTPGLRVVTHYGPDRRNRDLDTADIVLTTYETLGTSTALTDRAWHRVILDEAQEIKNPLSKRAHTVRSLNARHRIAATATPVENGLGDLWSIMAFAYPGLLAGRSRFMQAFGSDGGRGDVDALSRLVAPFMLRRVKSDPSLGLDLPAKSEHIVECALTREQVRHYQREFALMFDDLDGRDGVSRQGAVLRGLMRLKQACVHPQLLPAAEDAGLAGRSGKIAALERIVARAAGRGEPVVVFTQFASFAAPLAAHLTALGHRAVSMDGSMGKARRDQVIAEFCAADGPDVLVASLKTGGVGLNLVRARHVIHLDRWWNPAVEDQASDRVWRIGQTRDVHIHVLTCPGTLEDRIGQLLDVKRSTAASIVKDSSAVVATLNDAELDDLARLVHNRLEIIR